jgi:FMN phosphatase YigB (HAD superfamily)
MMAAVNQQRPVVVFDLGNVLIPWSLSFLYDKVIDDPQRRAFFLSEVFTPSQNARLDGGESLATLVADLCDEYPDWSEEFSAFEHRWPETLGDPISGSVAILDELVDGGLRCFALSNWGRETFEASRSRLTFLDRFEGVVISGFEGVSKPDAAIFELLCDRHGFAPSNAVFIDDSAANVVAATALGFKALQFTSPDVLRADLEALDLL